ncbi:uncharacterized protein [Triticum aestivum]|uniref:uncharacterized protein n=1 Tax=Triticum aestivum TaxID=4565 RepID=UPI001ABC20D4|nr:uncharacterized protein LOC123121377 [Triticum aestivum]
MPPLPILSVPGNPRSTAPCSSKLRQIEDAVGEARKGDGRMPRLCGCSATSSGWRAGGVGCWAYPVMSLVLARDPVFIPSVGGRADRLNGAATARLECTGRRLLREALGRWWRRRHGSHRDVRAAGPASDDDQFGATERSGGEEPENCAAIGDHGAQCPAFLHLGSDPLCTRST